MKKSMNILSCLLILIVFTSCTPNGYSSLSLPVAPPDYWPAVAWEHSTPEEQGMDSALLADALERSLAEHMRLHSLLVVRNGNLVTEAYYHPYTMSTKMHIQSVTKSVIGMLAGIAIEEGKLDGADQKILDFFQDREIANSDHDKENIRLANLMAMNSGLGCKVFSQAGPWMENAGDWTQFILDLEMTARPGEAFNYCNENAQLMSAILTQATGMNAREYANQRLFGPLGIAPLNEQDWLSDPQGNAVGGYGLYLTAADLAKLGLLFLNNGNWEGQQVIPTDWVADSTTQHSDKGDGSGYGYMWTLYPDESHYAALGLGGQQIHVFPSKNMVVVITADLEAFAESQSFEILLDQYILPAVKSGTALPANADGNERLNKALAVAAYPLKPAADLPETALIVTGRTYILDENPLGWEKVALYFEEGSDMARIQLDPMPPVEVGLDNIYHSNTIGPGMEMLLRGRWLLKDTFILDFPYPMSGIMKLGELGESELRFKFNGDEIKITCQQTVFGGDPITVNGTLAD